MNDQIFDSSNNREGVGDPDFIDSRQAQARNRKTDKKISNDRR